MPILAICSSTRSLKLKPFGRYQRLWDPQTDRQTDIATTRLNWPRADSVESTIFNYVRIAWQKGNKA